MKRTLESWSKGKKKKKVYEDGEWGYDEDGNSLNPDAESDNPSHDVYAMLDALRMHVAKVDMDEEAREYISDELLMIMDKMDANAGNMSEDETESPEVDRAEDAARKAKIKALQVQLKALQKTQSME